MGYNALNELYGGGGGESKTMLYVFIGCTCCICSICAALFGLIYWQSRKEDYTNYLAANESSNYWGYA